MSGYPLRLRLEAPKIDAGSGPGGISQEYLRHQKSERFDEILTLSARDEKSERFSQISALSTGPGKSERFRPAQAGPGQLGSGAPISAGSIAEGKYERFRAEAPGPERSDLATPISAGSIGAGLEGLMQLGPPAPWHRDDDGQAGPARRRRKGPRAASREAIIWTEAGGQG